MQELEGGRNFRWRSREKDASKSSPKGHEKMSLGYPDDTEHHAQSLTHRKCSIRVHSHTPTHQLEAQLPIEKEFRNTLYHFGFFRLSRPCPTPWLQSFSLLLPQSGCWIQHHKLRGETKKQPKTAFWNKPDFPLYNLCLSHHPHTPTVYLKQNIQILSVHGWMNFY